MKLQRAALLLTCSLTLSVHAQTPVGGPAKSKGTANERILASTLAPVGAGVLMALVSNQTGVQVFGMSLAAAGAVFGPVTGTVYAEAKAPYAGVPIRFLGARIAVGGVVNLAFASDPDSGNRAGPRAGGIGLVVIGGAIIAGSLV